jgi:transcription antitermination factor NusG
MKKQWESNWFAVYTLSRHEKQVELMLRRQSVETYLPLRRTWSRRRDRRMKVDLPALPGYLFVHCELVGETRAKIKKTPGVLRVVENGGEPCIIPPEQVASLRCVLAEAEEAEEHPYFKVGDRVEVVRGPMIGARGYLVRMAPARHRLVVAMDFVNRAVAVEIDPNDVDRCEDQGGK